MTINQKISALPTAPDPAIHPKTEFSKIAAASVLAQRGLPPELNNFATQANETAVEINAAAVSAVAAREQTSQDRIATGQDRTQTAADRVQTGLDRAAAQAAAQQIGTAAAFVDSNPVVKGSVDATKHIRFEVDGLTAGAMRAYTAPDKDGALALLDDVDHRADTYTAPTGNALDFANSGYVRCAPTAGQAATLTFQNFDTETGGNNSFRPVVIEGFRLGAANLTWPTINWIRPDGTTTTNIAQAGFTLSTTGTDFVILWKRNGIATPFGKVIR